MMRDSVRFDSIQTPDWCLGFTKEVYLNRFRNALRTFEKLKHTSDF